MLPVVLIFFMAVWQDHLQQHPRILEYNQQKVSTTYRIPSKFIGTYSGAKRGYLLLREDGTGSYHYDYHVPSRSVRCPDAAIEFQWGIIVDEEGDLVRFRRPYGYSYPLVMVSTGTPSFQSCTREAMLDYLLEHWDGHIAVSSSDDWVLQP